MSESQATVREINGELVIDDPVATALFRAVSKHNCKGALELHADRIEHFKRRVTELHRDGTNSVIVLANVDDVNGRLFADVLMPNHDWQSYRDQGQVPFARGIAVRQGIQEMVEIVDKEASEKLRSTAGLAIVVIDHGVAEVFSA